MIGEEVATAALVSQSPESPGKIKKKSGKDGKTEPFSPDASASADNTREIKQPLDLKHERLSGTVLSFVPSSGCGTIRSHLFEGELFFQAENIMPEFQCHQLVDGELIEFDVQANDQGRPHAVAIKPMLGKKPSECIGQRLRGYVRRCAERWGFLNSAAFDGDLFVHRDNLLPGPDKPSDGQPPLRAGQAVEFDVAVDDRGRTVAKQITTCAMLRPSDWIGHRLRGYIRSFQGAWGFINSDRFAGDLFVHRDSLMPQHISAQLSVGIVVEFDVERDHHRKGTKNRLVARNIAVIGPSTPTSAGYMMAPQGTMPGTSIPGIPHLSMDPSLYGAFPPPQSLPPAYGQQPPYYQGSQPYTASPQMSDPHLGAMSYAPPQYQYSHLPYVQQPMIPSPFLQHQAIHPGFPQGSYMVPPLHGSSGAGSYGLGALPTQAQPQVGQPQPGEMLSPPGARSLGDTAVDVLKDTSPSGSVPVALDGQAQGLLHITMHDWHPDQPGQLWVAKGTLVNISYRANHGWVYATTVQPGAQSGELPAEGWIPQAVAKRVSLGVVLVDWPAEGDGTLGVTKGEIIAVSKEAERGWVYGELVGQRRPGRPSDGWLPKKVLDSLQT